MRISYDKTVNIRIFARHRVCVIPYAGINLALRTPNSTDQYITILTLGHQGVAL